MRICLERFSYAKNSHLNPRKQPAPEKNAYRGDNRQNSQVEHDGEMRGIEQRAAKGINSIRERIEPRDDGDDDGKPFEREERTGEEEERHDDEVHDQLEALEIFEDRGDGCAEGCKKQRDEEHEADRGGEHSPAFRPEAGDEADHKHDHALHDGDRGAAERAADHDVEARDRGDECFLEEPELPVPDDFHAREDAGKENAHGDDTRREELQVVASPRLLVDGPKPEAEGEQEQQRLAKGSDDARA